MLTTDFAFADSFSKKLIDFTKKYIDIQEVLSINYTLNS